MFTKQRLSARLPATPVTPEVRQAFEALKRKHQCDFTDLQRAAFVLFLSQDDTDSVTNDTSNVNKVQSA